MWKKKISQKVSKNKHKKEQLEAGYKITNHVPQSLE